MREPTGGVASHDSADTTVGSSSHLALLYEDRAEQDGIALKGAWRPAEGIQDGHIERSFRMLISIYQIVFEVTVGVIGMIDSPRIFKASQILARFEPA